MLPAAGHLLLLEGGHLAAILSIIERQLQLLARYVCVQGPQGGTSGLTTFNMPLQTTPRQSELSKINLKKEGH